MFVALESLTMHPCELTSDAYAEANRTWCCQGCSSPKPGVEIVEARLVEEPRDPPLNAVAACFLPIAYRPFLERFPRDIVARDLHTGPVYGPDGRLLRDWVTFRGRKRVFVRGSKHATARKCPECGRDIYFAMGKKYLSPSPPDDTTLFESDGCGLVLAFEVFRTLDLGKWKKLEVCKLKILDPPPDGLGELFYP